MTDSSSWTAPSESVPYKVHLGVWTNWHRGRVLGATLTLESEYGLLLLSFTATFVGFVGSRFWRIITLALHRTYSTPEPRDAFHHQRQVVLRNSSSAVSTLWTSLQLAWCWRAIADGYLARTLPTIIFAASAFCAFTIAGGFTSSISSGISKEVLIDGSQCGVMVGSDAEAEAASTYWPWLSQFMNNAANYAQQCYSINTTGTLDCTTFVKSHLQYSSVLNAPCPFSDDLCRSNDSNLLLDSGLISTDEFGLNMPTNERMFYREVIHCAPLRTDGFVGDVSMDNNNYTRYSYGGFPGSYGIKPFNWTYEIENLDTQYRRPRGNPSIRTNFNGFGLEAMMSLVVNGTVWAEYSDIVPIPQLFLPDADLLVVFLSPQGIYFLNQTDDFWYHSVVPTNAHMYSRAYKLYRMDEAASPLGCAHRYQFCDYNKKCGSLASYTDAAISGALSLFHHDSSDIWVDSHSGQWRGATASRFNFFKSIINSAADIYVTLNALGPSSLLSSQHVLDGFAGQLPDNQWQLEVSHWFAIRMASLQAAFVNTAHGPTDEALLQYAYMPDNESMRTMCNNQKILSTRYISLSLFGLYFTYVTGIVIILASYVAEPLLTLLYSRRKYKEYKYLEWAANSTLQLQRLAYQGLGSEKWTNYTDDVPKTRPGYFLADLARAYPPEDDDGQVQEVKPTVHATSTTAPSVSETSASLRVSQQSQGAPSRPVSAISELPAEPVSPQPVSPQPVSPISQHPQG